MIYVSTHALFLVSLLPLLPLSHAVYNALFLLSLLRHTGKSLSEIEFSMSFLCLREMWWKAESDAVSLLHQR